MQMRLQIQKPGWRVCQAGAQAVGEQQSPLAAASPFDQPQNAKTLSSYPSKRICFLPKML